MKIESASGSAGPVVANRKNNWREIQQISMHIFSFSLSFCFSFDEFKAPVFLPIDDSY